MPTDRHNLMSILPSDATVTRSSGSNQIVGRKSTPPPAASSHPSGSPVVHEEMVEPLFVLVTCNGFLFSDRYCQPLFFRLALRVWNKFGPNDNMGRDPSDPSLIVFQSNSPLYQMPNCLNLCVKSLTMENLGTHTGCTQSSCSGFARSGGSGNC